MRSVVIGGGPAGLFFAYRRKLESPLDDVDVYERSTMAGDQGLGIVLPVSAVERWLVDDPQLADRLWPMLFPWSQIDIHHAGGRESCRGRRYVSVSRQVLIEALAERCAGVGVRVVRGRRAPSLARLRAEYDLVVAADGARSSVRGALAGKLGVDVQTSTSRHIWLSADRDASTFSFVTAVSTLGPLQAHAYPTAAGTSTFIVEVDTGVWDAMRRADLVRSGWPGAETPSTSFLAESFAEFLDGAKLREAGTSWSPFSTVRSATWSHENIVLVGDAAHTAHFSVGSGTTMAMDDALALTHALDDVSNGSGSGCLGEALQRYEMVRRSAVERLQSAADTSAAWFQALRDHVDLPVGPFAAGLMTRTGLVSLEELRALDPGFLSDRRNCAPNAPAH